MKPESPTGEKFRRLPVEGHLGGPNAAVVVDSHRQAGVAEIHVPDADSEGRPVRRLEAAGQSDPRPINQRLEQAAAAPLDIELNRGVQADGQQGDIARPHPLRHQRNLEDRAGDRLKPAPAFGRCGFDALLQRDPLGNERAQQKERHRDRGGDDEDGEEGAQPVGRRHKSGHGSRPPESERSASIHPD